MTAYDHRIKVRVTGTRNGWSTTLVDAPVFELRSNAQFGGIWDKEGVVKVVLRMYEKLVQSGDTIHIDIANLDGGDSTYRSFTF